VTKSGSEKTPGSERTPGSEKTRGPEKKEPPRRSQNESARRPRRSLPWLLFLLALLPRLVFWAEWNRAGLLSLPVVDANTFDKEARGLLNGSWPGPEPFWQAPLYSVFLGGIYRIAGPHWPAARLANALLGAGICVLTWRLSRRWLGPTGSLVAFGICALYGPLIYFEGQLLREILSTFLLLAWLLALRRAMASRRLLWWGLTGALLGVNSICRENSIILAPLALLWAWCGRSAGEASGDGPADGQARRGRIGARRIAAAWFALGLVLSLAPTTFFNWSREHNFIPISSSGGVNFWLGNNAHSRETVAIRPGRFWDDLVDRPRREAGAANALERSSFFYRAAFEWIGSHPLAFAGNFASKTAGLVTAHEIKRNQGIYESRRGSWLLRALLWKAGPFGFPFGILGPLALLGIVLTIRRRKTEPPDGLRLAACAGLYAFGIVLFFPTGRYRVPLVPLGAIFAAYGLRACGQLWSERRAATSRKPRAAGAAPPARAEVRWVAATLLGALVLVDGGWVRETEDPADAHFLRATALAEAGRNEEAIAELRQATQANPKHGEAWTTLAALYGMSGRREESMRAARAAIAIDSTDAQAWTNLGTTQLDAGDLVAAETNLRRALAVQPDLADAWLNLGSIAAARGQNREAEDDYRHALRIDPELQNARRNLAGELARSGRFDEGRALLEEGIRRAPEGGMLWLSLGNLEGRAGRLDACRAALGRAVRLMPENPDAWNNYGLALAQLGRRDEALRAFDRALQIAPGHAQALANRKRLTG
jgi:tetratricopeptide (TPR) repeat protein